MYVENRALSIFLPNIIRPFSARPFPACTDLVQQVGVLHGQLLLGGVEVAQCAVGLLQLGVYVGQLVLQHLGLLLLGRLRVSSELSRGPQNRKTAFGKVRARLMVPSKGLC